MRCALGVYGDNKPENTNRFDAMNGAPCAWIMGTIMDKRNGWHNVQWLWDDKFLGKNLKVDWQGRPLTFKRWINFSIAIFPSDGSVEAAARDEYVKEWTNQATQLRDGAPRNDRGKVSVRGDWEGNIGFYWKWSDARRQQIIDSWRRRYEAYEKVAPGLFEHVWCPNYANGGLNVEAFYPGDQYVHVIGMDHYWKHQYETTNPDTAWGKIYNAKYGLKWQADFADQRGKLKEGSEWAIPGDTKVGRSYLQRMRQHFIDREYCAAGYWDSDKDTDGRLSDNPVTDDSRKAFVEMFGMTYLPAKSATGDHPQPPIVAPPATSSPAAPQQPADPVLDLLARINEGSLPRGRFPEPTNGIVRQVEHMSWAALAAAGRKNGPVPAGEETDPTAVALAIYRLIEPHHPESAEAAAMIEGWLRGLETLLDGQLPPDAPDPEAPDGEVEALRAKLNEALRWAAESQERVAELQAENAALYRASGLAWQRSPPASEGAAAWTQK